MKSQNRNYPQERTKKIFVLCAFIFILCVIRVSYGLLSDDAVVAPTITSQTLWGNFIQRWTYNGRIFTDVLANIFYRIPIYVWKAFDVCIYALIALILSKIYTQNSWIDVLTVCVLILMFSMDYLNSAGYIASSTNYVYTVAGLLVVQYHLLLVRKQERISHLQYPVIVFCILYITNHDQTAVVLIGGLFLYLIYNVIFSPGNKAIIKNNVMWLILSVVCYILMLAIPGHVYRMTNTSEMEFWFPQYADWTLYKKIYHGFSTTVANFLFSNVKLFLLILLLLFILSLSQDKIYKKIIAGIPILTIVLSNYIGADKFILFYSYSCGMPDLRPLSESLIPFCVAVLSVCSIYITIFTCMTDKKRKYLALMLLVLASGSREMMGLSATLYASSFRTFTFFLYSVIACCLLILRELQCGEKSYLWFSSIGAMAAFLIL